MIIWLNGPFGIGKTTLANILHKRIENSYLYDPELLGDFLQHQLPQTVCPEDFQDYSVWRQSTYKIVFDLATKTDKIIIIPMTIYKKEYYQEIIQQLIQDKIPLEHYILLADKTTILERLDNRVNEDIWAKRHLDVCLKSFESQIPGQRLNTDSLKPEDVAKEILMLSEFAEK
ncbi:TPA: AAA family ATPase [Streptococcus suis]|uniref:AAA family ATPase n=1 Tax=Streptococcus suis TaxID=1307 RepID=UPI002A78A439|nr:AAA family ATPase [Streptococcus suis]HEL2303285.1 AAA family ATPase [Streptococcus suis]HEL2318731.1 AAA family ATPase [Streptococcus suis]HEM3457748.1 AAA family ATPase [Streptococcus suis]HEP1569752.1 AAA family ATPase [Streptococcus suis]